MILQFDTHGNNKQKLCAKYWIDQKTLDIVYGGAKGGAKSFTGCSLIFGDAFIYPGTHYFIARKTLSDIRKFTIPSIHEVFQIWGLSQNRYKFNGQDNFYELYNGSKVFLLDAKYMPSDPDYYRFGSMQMTRGWIEEAGEFEVKAKNNLQASIGRWKNDQYNLYPKLLQTCNPAHNYLFSDYYIKSKKKELEEHKVFIIALPQDNRMLPKNYVKNLKKSLSSSEIERLIYGNWEYNDDPEKLCEYDMIVDVFNNEHVSEGTKRISADLAMQGRDRFVAGLWSGSRVKVAIDKLKATGKSIEIDLKSLKVNNGVNNTRIVADADGLGNYLESYIDNIKTFRGGSVDMLKEFKEKYKNLKSACAFKLAEKINQGDLFIYGATSEQKERILKELNICLKRKKIDDGRLEIISKDQMKELLGHSPDYFDMLVMGMYWEINKTSGAVII